MDAYFQAVLNEMESATSGLTDNDLNTLRLAPGKWTAAQTLEHLILAFTGTTRNMRKLAEGKGDIAPPTLKQRIGKFVLVALGHMPEGRSAPEFTRPAVTPSVDVRERFRQAVQDMDSAIATRAASVPAPRHIAIHPILGPLTSREWRKFHLVHTRHHMRQIQAMRQAAAGAGATAA